MPGYNVGTILGTEPSHVAKIPFLIFFADMRAVRVQTSHAGVGRHAHRSAAATGKMITTVQR